MKNLIYLMIVMLIGLTFSCKKKEITPNVPKGGGGNGGNDTLSLDSVNFNDVIGEKWCLKYHYLNQPYQEFIYDEISASVGYFKDTITFWGYNQVNDVINLYDGGIQYNLTRIITPYGNIHRYESIHYRWSFQYTNLSRIDGEFVTDYSGEFDFDAEYNTKDFNRTDSLMIIRKIPITGGLNGPEYAVYKRVD